MSMNSDADEKLKEIVELSRLYDIYGELLSDHNRVVFEDYVLNNYSLGEIAGEVDISRQGVRDIVVRCSKKLREYEAKLGFLARIDEAETVLDELSEMLENDHMDADKALHLIRKVHDTLEQ